MQIGIVGLGRMGANIGRRFASGEWVPLPMCTRCGKKQAYPGSGICISCQADSELL